MPRKPYNKIHAHRGQPSKVADDFGAITEETKQQIEACAQRMCTPEEIAATLKIAERTFDRWKQDPEFFKAIDAAKAQGRASLRSILFKMAQGGSVAAAIFLAKQRDILGYRDNWDIEMSGPGGAPLSDNSVKIQIVYVNKPDQLIEPGDGTNRITELTSGPAEG